MEVSKAFLVLRESLTRQKIHAVRGYGLPFSLGGYVEVVLLKA